MRTYFRTNLDMAQPDVHILNGDVVRANAEQVVPRTGERVEIPFDRAGRRWCYMLEVVGVTYDYVRKHVSVELHIPSYQRTMSIAQWSEWFDAHRHGRCPPDATAPQGPAPEKER